MEGQRWFCHLIVDQIDIYEERTGSYRQQTDIFKGAINTHSADAHVNRHAICSNKTHQQSILIWHTHNKDPINDSCLDRFHSIQRICLRSYIWRC